MISRESHEARGPLMNCGSFGFARLHQYGKYLIPQYLVLITLVKEVGNARSSLIREKTSGTECRSPDPEGKRDKVLVFDGSAQYLRYLMLNRMPPQL